jgi:hypothetical protein
VKYVVFHSTHRRSPLRTHALRRKEASALKGKVADHVLHEPHVIWDSLTIDRPYGRKPGIEPVVTHPPRHIADARQKALLEIDAPVLHPERIETALVAIIGPFRKRDLICRHAASAMHYAISATESESAF